MAPIQVAVLGATGETGTSIVNGLLESTTAFLPLATAAKAAGVRRLVPTAVTATEDVGRFVARVVTVVRTVGRMVFVYGEVVTPNAAYELMESMSGEKVGRRYLDGPDLLAGIAEAKEKLANGSGDALTMSKLHVLQYYHSIGVRRDNTPEYAEYLGYLDGKKLYPDLVGTSLEEFFQSILDGKAQKPYANRS